MSKGGTSWLGGANESNLSAPGEGGAAIDFGFHAIASSKRKLKMFSSTSYCPPSAADAGAVPYEPLESPFASVDGSFELLPGGPGWEMSTFSANAPAFVDAIPRKL